MTVKADKIQKYIDEVNEKYAKTLAMLIDAIDNPKVVEKIVNVVETKLVEKEVPVEKVVEKIVEVEVPKETVVTVEKEVPGPERIVEVPGPERVVERIVEVEVPGPERIVEVEVEKIVEKTIVEQVPKEVFVNVKDKEYEEASIKKITELEDALALSQEKLKAANLSKKKLKKHILTLGEPVEVEKVVEVEKIVEVVDDSLQNEYNKLSSRFNTMKKQLSALQDTQTKVKEVQVEMPASGDLREAARLMSISEFNKEDLSEKEIFNILQDTSESEVKSKLGFWAVDYPKEDTSNID